MYGVVTGCDCGTVTLLQCRNDTYIVGFFLLRVYIVQRCGHIYSLRRNHFFCLKSVIHGEITHNYVSYFPFHSSVLTLSEYFCWGLCCVIISNILNLLIHV